MNKNLNAPILEELIIKRNPLQFANQDPILREYVLGGPDSLRDVRLILDAEVLDYLLQIAKRSKTNRCILHGAGIKLKVRRSQSGHIYETLHLDGRKPTPEVPPSEIKIPISNTEAKMLIERFKK